MANLRLRRLDLVVRTGDANLGAHVVFNEGLTVLRAPNNSGKSTILQSILYALGLEGMLSASREVPLPHAMTDRVEVDGVERSVVHSHVALEIENGDGRIVTVERAVVDSAVDRALVMCLEGPALTDPEGQYERQDYFVRRGGAAQRESGFHHFLAEFIGWQLPLVPRYEGEEAPLYMETLFPLLFIEQKQGWGGTRPRMPTYLGIRDVARRAVEFMLALSVLDRARERASLSEALAEVTARWVAERRAIQEAAARLGGQVAGIAQQPTSWEVAATPTVVFSDPNRDSISLTARLADLDAEIALLPIDAPMVGESSDESRVRLRASETDLRETLAQWAALDDGLTAAEAEASALDRRIRAAEEDRQRLLDVQLLERLGSSLGARTVAGDGCPTCHQPLDEAPDVAGEVVLTVEANIRLVDERLITLRSMASSVDAGIAKLRLAETSATARAAQLRAEIRALKTALTSANDAVNVAVVERRVRLERTKEDLHAISDRLSVGVGRLEEVAREAAQLQARLKDLRAELSDSDRSILTQLQRSLRDQLTRYGFGSLPVDEIVISTTSLLPDHEGFDLGFDISASDSIRTKWAYFFALAAVARRTEGNHPGLVVFDEPGQQEIDRASLESMFAEASELAASGVQVLIATSEEEGVVAAALGDRDRLITTTGTKLLVPDV